jgi:hypothetical protein
MKRTSWYAAMTKDEVQHSRMTFYEAVNYNTFVKSQKTPFHSAGKGFPSPAA